MPFLTLQAQPCSCSSFARAAPRSGSVQTRRLFEARSNPRPATAARRGPSVSCSVANGSSSSSGAAAAAGQARRHVQVEGANNILPITELNEYRRGVGLCIYRSDGLVFAAKRMDDSSGSWQMPQGGIDPLENPMKAALRELHEETGMVNCRIEASIDSWLEYSFPTPVKCQVAGGIKRYRGQTQKWFLLRFSGTDAEINLSCHGHPEFSEYAWLPLDALPEGVVDFKQGVYSQVARHFAPEIARRVAADARVRPLAA